MAAYARIGYPPTAKARSGYAARSRSARSALAAADPAWTDAGLLAGLRDLLAREGRLTSNLIDLAPHLPASSTVARRFGGLGVLYARLGYDPGPAQRRRLDARPAHRPEAAQANSARSALKAGLNADDAG